MVEAKADWPLELLLFSVDGTAVKYSKIKE